MSINVPQTLGDIRQKFRNITAQPNESLITDSEIDGYINTFYLFDLPSSVKLQSLKTTYTFYTQPNVDTYAFDTNNYYSIEPPALVAGYQMQYLQDRTVFFQTWPKLAYMQQVATGDGSTTAFTPTITGVPCLRSVNRTLRLSTTGQNPGSSAISSSAPLNNFINPGNIPSTEMFKEVVVSSQDSLGNNLTLADSGVLTAPNTGSLVVIDSPIPSQVGDIVGFINYETGAMVFDFSIAPADQAPINVQTTPYQPSRPQTILFYDNYFTMRPVPNATYEVVMNAYVKPTAFIGESVSVPASAALRPLVTQWWQLLAFGAAKIYFAERLDNEQWGRVKPFYDEQLSYVTRRTLEQLSTQRSNTIFTQQGAYPYDTNFPLF